MRRAALYLRVSTLDQHPETQLYDLQQMAVQRDYQIVAQDTDKVSCIVPRQLLRGVARGPDER